MQLTHHAKQRWDQRFPDLDPEQEWSKARRLGRGLREALRKKCPRHAHLIRGHLVAGVYYRHTVDSRICWVVNIETDNVITVFSLDPFNK